MKQTAFKGSRTKAFWNKYLAAFILAALITSGAVAQNDSAKRQPINAAYQWIGGGFTRLLSLPQICPTLAVKDSGAIAYCGRYIRFWDGYMWHPIAEKRGSDTLIIGRDTIILSGGSSLWEIDSNDYLTPKSFAGNRVLIPKHLQIKDSGIVATGLYGSGQHPGEGSGVKMIWWPARAGFRAGEVDGSEWNADRYGFYTFSFGYNNVSFGVGSATWGAGNIAKFGFQTLMGQYSDSTRDVYLAIGAGVSPSSRKNIFEVDKVGRVYIDSMNKVASTEWLVAYDTITKKLTRIPKDSVGGSGSQGLDEVLAVGNRSNDSIFLAPNSDTARLAYFLGTSITKGFSASDSAFRFSRLTSDYMSLRERNRGENGISLEGNITSAIAKVPFYNSDSMALMVMEYGANDMLLIGTFGFTYANYITNYERLIDTVTARGWPADKVYMTSTPYISQLSTSLQNTYNNGVDSLADVHGFTYVNVYSPTLKQGSPLLADGVHPNDPGNRVIAQYVQAALEKNIFDEGQMLTVKGLGELSDFKYAAPDAPDSTLQVVGLNDSGYLRRFGYYDLIRNARYKTPGNIWISDSVRSAFSIVDKYQWFQEANLAPSVGTGLFAYYTGDRGYLEAINAATNAPKVLNINGRYGGRITMGSTAYTSPNTDALFNRGSFGLDGILRIGPATNINYTGDKAFTIEISGGGGNPAYLFARNYTTAAYEKIRTLSKWAFSEAAGIGTKDAFVFIDGKAEIADTLFSRGKTVLENVSNGSLSDSGLVKISTGEVRKIKPAALIVADSIKIVRDSIAVIRALISSSGSGQQIYDYVSRDSITTTNATTATAFTFTPPNNQAGIVRVELSVLNADATASASFYLKVKYRKVSGTVTLGTVASVTADDIDAALSGITFTIDQSSGAIRGRFTGLGSTTLAVKSVTTVSNVTIFP